MSTALSPAPGRPVYSKPDPAVLRRCRTASGYRNVYRPGPDARGWRVRVNEVNLNGRWRTPLQAATALAAWYADFYGRYGIDWRTAAVRRERNLTRVSPMAWGTWAAWVGVMGIDVPVSFDMADANLTSHVSVPLPGVPLAEPQAAVAAKPGEWATREQARAAAREWVARFRASLGRGRRFAGLYLWRA